MRIEQNNHENSQDAKEQFFEFQEKATKVIETQEKVINSHMVVIKVIPSLNTHEFCQEDANLLT